MGKDTTYQIDLASLEEGRRYEYDYIIDRSFFESRENEDILGADVAVSLDVTKRHGSYRLEFGFEGWLETACDRCLDAVRLPIDTDYDIVVRHGEEYDDSADDLLVIPASWTRLDVSPLIYDTLLLEIPIRCVHPEGECNTAMEARLEEHRGRGEEDMESEADQE